MGEFSTFYEENGRWIYETLSPLTVSLEPQLVLDALYEASIGNKPFENEASDAFNVERKNRGAFFTPYEFAYWVVSETAPNYSRNLQICDPACGSGVFLAAVVDYYVNIGALNSVEKRSAFIKNQLTGFDLDPRALLVTRLRLSILSWVAHGSLLDSKLLQKDTLHSSEQDPASFDWVIGNPPWDKLIFQEREFFGAIEPSIFALKTARERKPVYLRLLQDPDIATRWEKEKAEHHQYLDAIRCQYPRLASAKGHLDKYLVFVEWALSRLSQDGKISMILPNAFYGTTSAAQSREFLLRNGWLNRFWGFSNADKIFDASPGLRFCVIELRNSEAAEQEFVAASFVPGLEGVRTSALLQIPTKLLIEDGCRIPEIHSEAEMKLWVSMKNSRLRIGDLLSKSNIQFYQELNMTLDSPRFETWREWSERFNEVGDPRLEPLRTKFRNQRYLTVHEKGTFSSYEAWLKDAPRYVCSEASLEAPPEGIRQRAKLLELSKHWRLALRATIHATEARKVVAALLPPGTVVGNSALTESMPAEVQWEDRLLVLGLLNAKSTNWFASKYVATNLNQHILNAIPLPSLSTEQQEVIRLCAVGLTLFHIAQDDIVEEFPADLRSDFLDSNLRDASSEELRALIDTTVEQAFVSAENLS